MLRNNELEKKQEAENKNDFMRQHVYLFLIDIICLLIKNETYPPAI